MSKLLRQLLTFSPTPQPSTAGPRFSRSHISYRLRPRILHEPLLDGRRISENGWRTRSVRFCASSRINRSGGNICKRQSPWPIHPHSITTTLLTSLQTRQLSTILRRRPTLLRRSSACRQRKFHLSPHLFYPMARYHILACMRHRHLI